ncbi:ribbon-helix-helix protein, CopG family [Nocardia abscessus]|uniref:ribbon-helix-helix protein, CopG family n=1 Tax=Nocardia abscessus TaxID=120957 RepID=UPI0018939B34|nr:ribbon-helix-helix protein, CopG family [Nocardia abscessus]MBF6337294.1 ribbon-helix-helix protein, CopG family [Nocardia abscessus]
MPLERITVYADADDLAVIEDASARTGVSDAEIIRQAIHAAALRLRRRSQRLRLGRFASNDPTLAARVDDILAGDFGENPDRR